MVSLGCYAINQRRAAGRERQPRRRTERRKEFYAEDTEQPDRKNILLVRKLFDISSLAQI